VSRGVLGLVLVAAALVAGVAFVLLDPGDDAGAGGGGGGGGATLALLGGFGTRAFDGAQPARVPERGDATEFTGAGIVAVVVQVRNETGDAVRVAVPREERARLQRAGIEPAVGFIVGANFIPEQAPTGRLPDALPAGEDAVVVHSFTRRDCRRAAPVRIDRLPLETVDGGDPIVAVTAGGAPGAEPQPYATAALQTIGPVDLLGC